MMKFKIQSKKLIENKEITSYQINKDTGISYGNIMPIELNAYIKIPFSHIHIRFLHSLSLNFLFFFLHGA